MLSPDVHQYINSSGQFCEKDGEFQVKKLLFFTSFKECFWEKLTRLSLNDGNYTQKLLLTNFPGEHTFHK